MKLVISASPHIDSGATTRKIMGDVLIALSRPDRSHRDFRLAGAAGDGGVRRSLRIFRVGL